MKWITRERPKIDRIACPWLIARFGLSLSAAGAFFFWSRRCWPGASACSKIAYDLALWRVFRRVKPGP